jgi:hypothetical protein
VDERLNSSQIKPKRTPKPAKTERQQIFVRNLRWAIERLGLTLRALAEKAGVDEVWLRRAATQGVHWTKPSGTEAVKKLEEFLGCPTHTLWDQDGHYFRSCVTAKHLRGCDPVTDFEKVVRHFERNPPPLLSKIIEVIQHFERRIDDPSLEPPDVAFGHLVSSHAQRQEGIGSTGISGHWMDTLVSHIEVIFNQLCSSDTPSSSEIRPSREKVEKAITDQWLSVLAHEMAVRLYAEATNQQSEDVRLLIGLRRAEEEASVAAIRARFADEATRLAQKVKDVRQIAKSCAVALIDSLTPLEQKLYVADFQGRPKALTYIESCLCESLASYSGEVPVTIEQAVEELRREIFEDIRAKTARISGCSEDSGSRNDDDLSDDIEKERDDRDEEDDL